MVPWRPTEWLGGRVKWLIAGPGDTTGASEDGEEGVAADQIIEDFQNSSYKKVVPYGGRSACHRAVSFIVSSVSHDLPGRLKSSPRGRGPQEYPPGIRGLAGFDREAGHPLLDNPTSRSESKPCLEVRSGGRWQPMAIILTSQSTADAS